MHNMIFSRIADASTSNEAWDILKKKFQEFTGIVSKMKSYDEEIMKLFGQIEENCWSKKSQAIYSKEEEKESMLFMAYSVVFEREDGWFVDSGCSYHMNGDKSAFKKLDETKKKQLCLVDNKQIHVEDEGIIVVQTSQGKIKLIQNVLFAS
ncbi:integrase [Gossypium australe]|uniref:Integrase n=1 Tax=Gossypium australe TaxID=47621 RepID=A0A5B6VW31_9ROSI|nr:integrase [Gossypium australe]